MPSAMSAMAADEARNRFATARVARLATVRPTGEPHLVPITFAVRGDEVVSVVDSKPKSTTALRRLENITAHPAVSLLVDEYDDDWERLWWVRADGHATVRPQDPAAVDLLATRYPQYRRNRPGGPVVVVTVTRWVGWAAH